MLAESNEIRELISKKLKSFGLIKDGEISDDLDSPDSLFYLIDVMDHNRTGLPQAPYRVRIRIDIYSETFSVTLLLDDVAYPDLKEPRLTDIARKVWNYPAIKSPFYWNIFMDHVWENEQTELGAISRLLENLGFEKLADSRTVCVSANKKYVTPVIDLTAFADDFPRLSESFKTFLKSLKFAGTVDTEPDWHCDELAPRKRINESIKTALNSREFQVDIFFFMENAIHLQKKERNGTGALGISEILFTSMLDGNALHISAPPSTDGRRPYESNVLIDGTEDKHQIGRLQRRLNVLSELKACALIDYDLPEEKYRNFPAHKSIHEAAKELQEINGKLNKFGKKLGSGLLDDTENAANDGTEKAANDDTKKAANDVDVRTLLTIHEKFSEIDESVRGGLANRLEKSKYYLKPYRDRMQDLRIVRLEGWQPYDEFARRYIFQIFDRIENTSILYENISREISRLTFITQAALTTNYQNKLESVTGEMVKSTDAISEHAGATRKHAEATQELQRRAGLISVFLVFASGASIGATTGPTFPNFLGNSFTKYLPAPFLETMIFGLAALLLFYIFKVGYDWNQKRKNRKKVKHPNNTR